MRPYSLLQVLLLLSMPRRCRFHGPNCMCYHTHFYRYCYWSVSQDGTDSTAPTVCAAILTSTGIVTAQYTKMVQIPRPQLYVRPYSLLQVLLLVSKPKQYRFHGPNCMCGHTLFYRYCYCSVCQDGADSTAPTVCATILTSTGIATGQ